MTTVAKLIDWLQTLPPEATVECPGKTVIGWETYTIHKPVDLDSCYVSDYRSDEYKTNFPDVYGKVIVLLQGE